MPSAPKTAPIVLSIEPGSPEYKVVETLRDRFATTSEEGKKRRANGKDLVGQVISNLLLKASAETLNAFSEESINKPGANGKEAKVKIKDVIQSIADARAVASTSAGKVDVRKMSADERARLLKEIEEANRADEAAKKAGKGTTGVTPV